MALSRKGCYLGLKIRKPSLKHETTRACKFLPEVPETETNAERERHSSLLEQAIKGDT